MLRFMEESVPVVPVEDPVLHAAGVSLWLQREDLIDPLLSGNKWYKLKYNLQQARREEHDTLLTFGGAYSNHVYATAAAGKVYGFRTIGLIRGEATEPLNYTLQKARNMGMQLHYLDRQSYRRRQEEALGAGLHQQFGRYYLLPEGGTNLLAVQGCREIGRYAGEFDYVCAAAGTGGTLAGLALAMKGKGQLLGFSALKNGQFLLEDVQRLTQAYTQATFANITLVDAYHFGGYAKFKPPLIDFINHFGQQHQMMLDPVYTGKMLYGIYELANKGYFPSGSRVLAIHSGGIQGVYGYNERFGHRQPIFHLAKK